MAKIHMRLKLVCVTIIVIAQVVSHLRATNAITDDLYDELIIPYDVQMSDSIVPKARFKTHVRSPSRLVHLQRPQYNLTDLINLRKRQLSYVWSPLSEQIFPIRDVSKLSYNDILALTEGYKAQQQSSLLSQTKPSREYEDNSEIVSCRTIRAPIEVTKDDISKSADGSERLIRTCKGLVHINRCEGSCVSSVQPSVKSRTGFRKKCSCCNEANFRRIQVRLNECYAPGDLSESNLVTSPLLGYMDIELDEPMDCKCRVCDG